MTVAVISACDTRINSIDNRQIDGIVNYMTNTTAPTPIFHAGERVTCVDDPQSRGTIVRDVNLCARTAEVVFDFDANPYGIGSPRRFAVLVDDLVPVDEPRVSAAQVDALARRSVAP